MGRPKSITRRSNHRKLHKNFIVRTLTESSLALYSVTMLASLLIEAPLMLVIDLDESRIFWFGSA
jgi:hypothetical protein